MINAMQELLAMFKDEQTTCNVRCAVVGLRSSKTWDLDLQDIVDGQMCLRRAVLVENWDNDQWCNFLQDLNFNYDNGYGTQELFGVVWFKDGSWLERDEYDGSEWWQLKKSPTLPERME